MCEGLSPQALLYNNGRMNYTERTYRSAMGGTGLVPLEIHYRETDLWIGMDRSASEGLDRRELTHLVLGRVRTCWHEIGWCIARCRDFLSSYVPIKDIPGSPTLCTAMLEASRRAGTGPMAAVAGAVADAVGRELSHVLGARELIVENGGDIYVQTTQGVICRVFAGASPLSGQVRIHIPKEVSPVGVCTSSATVGPSKSFGRADAVTVVAADAAFADAAATAWANRVKSQDDIAPVIEAMKDQREIIAGVIILGDRLGFFGDIPISFGP